MFGPVASDPTVSRPISKPASGGQRALAALRAVRAKYATGYGGWPGTRRRTRTGK